MSFHSYSLFRFHSLSFDSSSSSMDMIFSFTNSVSSLSSGKNWSSSMCRRNRSLSRRVLLVPVVPLVLLHVVLSGAAAGEVVLEALTISLVGVNLVALLHVLLLVPVVLLTVVAGCKWLDAKCLRKDVLGRLGPFGAP